MLSKLALKIRNTFPNAYQIILNVKQGRYNYTFSKEKYPHSFLVNSYPNTYSGEKAPEVIYCFWTGDNPLTENRKKGIKALEKNAGITVKLITPENISEYILPDYPLHKGYELLQGGLAPIEHRFIEDKEYENYDILVASENKIYNDLRKYSPLLIGNCGFICKPYTPITTEWYNEVHNRMDELYDYFNQSKSKDLNTIPYFYLVQIFHPLMLKYHKNIIQYKKLLPVLEDYR